MRVLVLLLVLTGCEIAQVTVSEPVSSVIAEVYLRVDDGAPDGIAILHRTSGSDPIVLSGASIRAVGEGGGTIRFQQRPQSECIDGELPEDTDPACYRTMGLDRFNLQAGERYEILVDLQEGASLAGTVTLPSDFEIRTPSTAPLTCDLSPFTIVPVIWTQAEGAWAYVPEAEIFGLQAALAEEGIPVASEPVTLLGLSVSQRDTTIAFPSEFGIFNRFSDDREVLVFLQQGFPETEELLTGRVVVSAQERNATNWNRGGIFNPSGQVRVPSLFGDGTGVAAGVVNRSFEFSFDAGEDFEPCA